MPTDTKVNAIKDVDILISNMGDLALDGIYDLTDRENQKIRTLNIPKLVENLIKATLHLNTIDTSSNNVRYTASEQILIDTFLANFNKTIEYFMDFLDYDGDNQIKLIEFEKSKEKIEIGADLNAFIDDMKDIISSFKTNASSADKIFSVLSNVLLYTLSDEYTEAKDDIINFNESVKITFGSLKKLKNIDHKKIFDSKVDDMISFIMMFCVLMIPIIDLINKKLGDLNKADIKSHTKEDTSNINESVIPSKDEEIILPNNEVADAIKNYYGDHLNTVLGLVNQLTKKMIKVVESKKWKKLKTKLCCCCAGDSIE